MLLVALAVPASALANANAVIPTSPNPGTSPNVINNYQQVNFGPNDDGSWPCGPSSASAPVPCPVNGDNGPTPDPLGFTINFFGTGYASTYINNNGNVTFANYLSQYTPTALTSFGSPIIAPFFADVDTRGAQSAIVNLGTGTLNGQKVFVVNWPGVGCYNANSSVLDDFQMILIDRPDLGTGPNGDDFEIEFNYDTMPWDTGQASGGDASCINGPPGNSAYVGFSNGTSTPGDEYQLAGSGVPNSFIDANTTTGLIYNDMNSSVLGRYLFSVINGQPTTPTSLSTTLSGGNQTGTSISVPSGTAVTDSATLSGTNAATATGTITYDVYSDASCTTLVSGGTAETITTPGTMPASQPVSLTTPGNYYWQATYSGDTLNNGSTSTCAPGNPGDEVETVAGDPQITNVTGIPIHAVENSIDTFKVASFTDPDASLTPSNFSAQINWGDGTTSAGTITETNGVFYVSGQHKYHPAGTYAVTVTITDPNGPTEPQANTTATIRVRH